MTFNLPFDPSQTGIRSERKAFEFKVPVARDIEVKRKPHFSTTEAAYESAPALSRQFSEMIASMSM
jgi:hypothetical protein